MKKTFCYGLILGLIFVPSMPGYALWGKEKAPPKYSDLKVKALAALTIEDYKSAAEYMEQALGPSQNEYGLESRESAECLGLLGAIYYQQGLTVQGEEFHELAREIRAKLDQATVIEGLEWDVFRKGSHPGKAELEAARQAAAEAQLMEMKNSLNYLNLPGLMDSPNLMDSMEPTSADHMTSMPDSGEPAAVENLVDDDMMSAESQP